VRVQNRIMVQLQCSSETWITSVQTNLAKGTIAYFTHLVTAHGVPSRRRIRSARNGLLQAVTRRYVTTYIIVIIIFIFHIKLVAHATITQQSLTVTGNP